MIHNTFQNIEYYKEFLKDKEKIFEEIGEFFEVDEEEVDDWFIERIFKEESEHLFNFIYKRYDEFLKVANVEEAIDKRVSILEEWGTEWDIFIEDFLLRFEPPFADKHFILNNGMLIRLPEIDGMETNDTIYFDDFISSITFNNSKIEKFLNDLHNYYEDVEWPDLNLTTNVSSEYYSEYFNIKINLIEVYDDRGNEVEYYFYDELQKHFSREYNYDFVDYIDEEEGDEIPEEWRDMVEKGGWSPEEIKDVMDTIFSEYDSFIEKVFKYYENLMELKDLEKTFPQEMKVFKAVHNLKQNPLELVKDEDGFNLLNEIFIEGQNDFYKLFKGWEQQRRFFIDMSQKLAILTKNK